MLASLGQSLSPETLQEGPELTLGFLAEFSFLDGISLSSVVIRTYPLLCPLSALQMPLYSDIEPRHPAYAGV